MFEFLKEMKKYCELIIFTAATKEYADIILDSLEIGEKYFEYRLYRQHTSFHGISIVKDLSWLGRDLNKTLIIDNLSENFKLHYSYGLQFDFCIGCKNSNSYEYSNCNNFCKYQIKTRQLQKLNLQANGQLIKNTTIKITTIPMVANYILNSENEEIKIPINYNSFFSS